MTVAFLCDYYHPFEVGGAERSAERLAIELGRGGDVVVVVTPNYGAPRSEIVNGVLVERLPFPERLAEGVLARRLWLSNPLLHLFYGIRLAALIRRRSIDLLHIQNSTLIVAGVLAAALVRVPTVVTIRDLAYLPSAPAGEANSGSGRPLKWKLDALWARMERALKRAALGRASEVVFVSRALRELYSTARQAVSARAHVVYNIGPPHRVVAGSASFGRDPRTVAFVGKLSTGKGLHVLYQAAALVAEKFPDVRFVIAGSPGAGFASPPAAVASVCSLPGRLEAEEVRALMNRATVLVSPGIWPEPLSRVLLEAMSAGLPIVATCVGGNGEALEHERSAWMVPPADADALADGICRLLSEPEKARELAAGAQLRFDQLFSPGAVVPRILDVYTHAARG